jgi:threonine aldolase
MSKLADFRSDTVTKPTPEMLEAMAAAEVGDDVLGHDPTVRRLEESVAKLLGKDEALFVPSGTMGNQIAVRLHTQPGDALVVESRAHIADWEAGGAAWISGVSAVRIPGEKGILDPEDVLEAFTPPDPHNPPITMLAVENTSNAGGGAIYPMETLDALTALGKEKGVSMHLDGARLFHASAETGVDLDRFAQGFDTVMICLSKALGAPVGSVLALPKERLERARRIRKGLGGGLRQAGYLAAAGLYALENHRHRLAEDHAQARRLAQGAAARGYPVRYAGTNLVYIGAEDPVALCERLESWGVWALPAGPGEVRLVTHLDVDDDDVETALQALADYKK